MLERRNGKKKLGRMDLSSSAGDWGRMAGVYGCRLLDIDNSTPSHLLTTAISTKRILLHWTAARREPRKQ